MKNIFKVLAVALIAGSMLFVACKKDEDDTNNNTNTNTPTNPTNPTNPTDPTDPTDPVTPTTVMTLAIDGQTFNIEEFGAGMASSTSGEEFLAQVLYNGTYGLQFPFGGTTTGTYDYDSDVMAIYFTGDDNADFFDYNGDDMPTWASCGAFGDSWTNVWGQLNFTQEGPSQNITAIDMNNYTMTCVYYDGLVNLKNYTSQQVLEGKEFTLTLTNATWEPVQWQTGKSVKGIKKIRL